MKGAVFLLLQALSYRTKQDIIMQAQYIEQVMQKLQALAPSRLHKVEGFTDFLVSATVIGN